MTEETKELFPAQDLQETALNNELIRFSRGQGSDFYNVGQQMSSIMPALNSVFMMLGNWPNSLASTVENLQQRNLAERRGAMAMHLRREAHVRYLMTGREDILTQTEANIESLSPYYRVAEVDNASFENYLALLLPHASSRWSIKHINSDLQNKHILHIAELRYPEKDSTLKHETDDGYVEFVYTEVELGGKLTGIEYHLNVGLYRIPPASFVNEAQSSRSISTMTFVLRRNAGSTLLSSISLKAVVVYDALERLGYVGSVTNVEVSRFQRLIRSFLDVYGTVDPAHVKNVDCWLTGNTPPPVQLVFQSSFEKLHDTWKEGEEKSLHLEDLPIAHRIFFGDGMRPLGMYVPRWLSKHGSYSPYFLGLEATGDLPIMAVSQHEGRHLAYAEWQLFVPGETADAAPVCRSSHFLLVIDKQCMIVGERDHRALLEGRWQWTVKGKRGDRDSWESASVTPATYDAIFDYLKQARGGYVEALRESAIWPQVEAGATVDQWVDLRFDEHRVNAVRKLKDQGFVSFQDELRCYNYGRYFQETLEVAIS